MAGSLPSEDDLPPGQEPIQTSNVKRFKAFLALITDVRKAYSTMGVVTGLAGIGKTVSIKAYLDSLKPLAHTGLPHSLKITVKPRSTPKALAVEVVTALRDKPHGRNIYEVADEAAAAVIRNDLDLLIVDEADRLNEDSFELLRHLFDTTGCPIVVVGLPRILSVIDRHEKFASRVGLRMDFLPLASSEVLKVVLPGLVFPHWKFDPDCATDHAMGERIVKIVGPSLRKLRNLLQIASQIATAYERPCITPDILDEAFCWSASSEDKRRITQRAETEKSAPDPRRGEFEHESERRQEGHNKQPLHRTQEQVQRAARSKPARSHA
jgi:hypothetical protein